MRPVTCVDLDCGILFSTYDLLISTQRLTTAQQAAVKAAKNLQNQAMLREEVRDDVNADEIIFGAQRRRQGVLVGGWVRWGVGMRCVCVGGKRGGEGVG